MISTSIMAIIIFLSYGSNIKHRKLNSYLVIENNYIFKVDVIDLACKIVVIYPFIVPCHNEARSIKPSLLFF